jgi:hypothetical protein
MELPQIPHLLAYLSNISKIINYQTIGVSRIANCIIANCGIFNCGMQWATVKIAGAV